MKTKRLIKNIGLYFLGTFATKILQFLFIPVYTKYINTHDFGYYSLTLSLISLIVPILYQSIWEGILRFVIVEEKDKHKILTTTNYYCIGVTVIYGFIFYLVSTTFEIQYGFLIFVMGISHMGVSYWQFSARALKKNKIYAVSSVVNTGITIAMNFFFIVGLHWQLLGLFVANTIGNLAMILVLEMNLKLLTRLKVKEFDRKLLKSIIIYSLPLSINAVSWWLVGSCNNVIITYKLGSAQNGIYSVAKRLGSIISLLTSVINKAWLEESFRIYNDSDKDEYFNTVFDILSRFLLSGVLLLIPVTYTFYYYFVYGDYKAGVILTPIIYLNAVFTALASYLGSRFLADKESDVIFKTTLLGGIISATGSYIFVDVFGLIGVAIASLIGTLVMFFIRIPLLKKRMKLKIDCIVILGITLLCFCFMFISSYNAESLIFQIGVLVFALVLVFLINKKLITSLIHFIVRNKNKVGEKNH